MILALDLSVKRTGWACGDGTSEETEYGAQSFDTKSTQELCQKHLLFRDWLCDLLDLQQPTQVVYEEPVSHGQRGNVEALVGLKVLLKVECAARNIPCNGIWPTTMKSQFVGNGKAEKCDVQTRAATLFHYDKINDVGGDCADALGLLWVWQYRRDVIAENTAKTKEAAKRKRAAKKGTA